MSDVKAISDETQLQKIKAAKAALRGGATHAATLINANDNQGVTMKVTAKKLREVAEKMGGVTIMYRWNPTSEPTPSTVKDVLRYHADSLLNGVVEK